MNFPAISAFASLITLGCLYPAGAAESAYGVWERDTGSARIRVAPCGGKLCATVIWVRDTQSPTKVGMRVFYDAESTSANAWEGLGFNPLNQKTYRGSITVAGDTMTSTGCLIALLVCESFYWKRLK